MTEPGRPSFEASNSINRESAIEASLQEIASTYQDFTGWPEDIPSSDIAKTQQALTLYRLSADDVAQILADFSEANATFNLTLEEYASLYYYTHHGGIGLNAQMRSGHLSDTAQHISEKLSQGLAKLPDYNGQVYRGLVGISPDQCSQIVDACRQNKQIVFNQFVSAAKSVDASRGGLLQFNIESLHAKEVSFAASELGEQEVVFLPQTIFIVTSIRVNPNSAIINLTEASE